MDRGSLTDAVLAVEYTDLSDGYSVHIADERERGPGWGWGWQKGGGLASPKAWACAGARRAVSEECGVDGSGVTR